MQKRIILILTLILILIVIIFIHNVTFAYPAWTFVSCDTTGLNTVGTSASLYHPKLAGVNGTLYAIWQENHGTYEDVDIKFHNGNSWVDAGITGSRLHTTLNTARYPTIVEYQNTLYAIWQEMSNGGVNQIHFARYNGVSWERSENYAPGDGKTCLNVNEGLNAEEPTLTVYNTNLYAAWIEQQNAGTYQVRVGVFNGTDWDIIDPGDGLNYNSNMAAHWPMLAVYNDKLYIAWQEANSSGITQIHVKVRTGSASWAFVGGGSESGINYSSSNHAYNPVLAAYNGDLYLAWEEKTYDLGGGVFRTQVRLKKYHDTPGPGTWSYVDGGGMAGLNKNPSFPALHPSFIVFNNALYVSWHETATVATGNKYQIRCLKYENGVRSFIDGDASTGLNLDTTMSAADSSIAVFNGELYAIWHEHNGTSDQIRVKKTFLPAMINSVTVPANRCYKTGQNLDFIVNFNKTVNVSDTALAIPITLDSGPVSAIYYGGSGTPSLTFRYTVASENLDLDGITVGTAISLNGGTIRDTVHSMDAEVNMNSVQSTTGILVDGVPPTVSSFSPANNAVDVLTDANLSIDFNENIVKGTGNILIKKTSDNNTVEIIDVAGSNVTITGGSVTIDPATALIENVDYYVLIEPTAFQDMAGNNFAGISLNSTWHFTTQDSIAPTLISAIRTENTHITVTLSEPCVNLTIANDGGFTVCETGTPAITYNVSAISQGINASHVVLTVANLAASAKEGVTVKYTAGGNGTVQDSKGNLMATNDTGVAVAAWDTTAPTITSGTIASSNGYIDIVFGEGVYGASDGVTPLTAAMLALNFTQNGGTATNAVISSVKKDDNANEGSASALTGGETTVRVFLTVTGNSSGLETIEIKPANGASIYDQAGNAVSALQTTGVKTLNDRLAPMLVSAVRTDNTHITVTLNENCANLTKANNGGFAVCETGTPLITYTVSAIAQEVDASHVVLTVANLAVSGKEGVAVKYTAGGNGTVQDSKGNLMATNDTGVAVAAWDTTAPTITSGTIASSNGYIDIVFNEGVYGASDGVSPMTAVKLALTFTRNGGTATNAVISSVKKNDSTTEASASALTGGETTVRVFLSITGNPLGVETIEIKPANMTSIYDIAGNAASVTQTTGPKTLNDKLAPILISAVRTDNTHLTVTLSENCTNLTKSNHGGFTVHETGAPGVVYNVSATTQVDASHVSLTVADMGISAKEGVTVKYTAGGFGTIQDTAGNTMATNSIGVAAVPWDTTGPAITAGTLTGSNRYIDVTFSEGIYGTGNGAGAVTSGQLQIVFANNSGTATNAVISSVKKTDSQNESSASALVGGETTIRVFLTIIGNPNGSETIEIKPVNGASIYDRAGNAASALQTTGAKSLHPVTLSLSSVQVLTETNLATTNIQVTVTGATLLGNSLNAANFTLLGTPSLSVGSATYIDDTHCALKLTGSLNGDINNLGLTIKAAEISNGFDITSANTLRVIDDLPDGKVTVTVGTGSVPDNSWHTAENYQGDYRTVWSGATFHLGKGVSGRNVDLWLYNPGLIGNQTGQIPATAKVDRAELILKLKNISGDMTKPRQIKIYRITDPDSKGKPYFGSQDGLRTGLDFLYRDHRLGRNIPWRTGASDITSICTSATLLDTFEFIPKSYQEGKYYSVRLDISNAVKAWVGDTDLNQGLYLTIDGTWNSGEMVEMYGPTATNSSDRPQLQVTYLTTGDGSSPAAVTLNVSSIGSNQVVLGWNNPATATGFRVIRKEGVTSANPGDGTLIYDGPATSFDDHDGLENGKIYYYTVYAYNASRNYSPKAYKRAIPGNYGSAPAAPTNFNFTVSGRNVTLSWTDNATNEEAYFVFRNSTKIGTLSANQITYYDRNAPAGIHTYQVQASNTIGQSALKTVDTVNVPNLPDAPADLGWSIVSSSEVQLRWTNATGVAYRIEVLDANGGLLRTEAATVDLNSDPNITQYPVLKLTANTGYRFRVVAVNAHGENTAETELVKTAADSKPLFF